MHALLELIQVRFASVEEIWAGTAHAVFDNVGDEDGEDDGGGEGEERDVEFVELVDLLGADACDGAATGCFGGVDEGADGDEGEGEEGAVDEEGGDGDSLDGCKRVGDAEVGEGELAVEGIGAEKENVGEEEKEEDDPVGDVGGLESGPKGIVSWC